MRAALRNEFLRDAPARNWTTEVAELLVESLVSWGVCPEDPDTAQPLVDALWRFRASWEGSDAAVISRAAAGLRHDSGPKRYREFAKATAKPPTERNDLPPKNRFRDATTPAKSDPAPAPAKLLSLPRQQYAKLTQQQKKALEEARSLLKTAGVDM